MHEFVEQWHLAWEDPLPRLGEREPGGAVDFRKPLHASAAAWPFELERVASQGRRIPISTHCPSLNNLAGFLHDRRKRQGVAGGCPSQFLGHFPTGSDKG